MNYYEHHIGDYAEATAHLSFVEDAAYSRMMRKYYSTEKPLPADIKTIQRLVGARTKEEREAVETILQEFFNLQEDGWHQSTCDEVIERYLQKSGKARASAQARWNKTHSDGNANASSSECERMPDASQTQCDGNALQSPNTNHQTPDTSKNKDLEHASPTAPPERKKSTDRATRIPADFSLTDERKAIAAAEKLPDAERTFAKFRDYWTAAPGAKGRKIDWDATWRNWCRSEADRGVNGSGTRQQQPYKTKFDQAMEALDRA